MGLAPNAGVWEGVAGKGDPKDDPNEGVWLFPNPAEGAELKTNGVGPADGADEEAAEGAAAPKLKVGAGAAAAAAAGGAAAAAALVGEPKMKG